jgi:hypothetical protein
MLLRPGNAGSNTVADHIRVLSDAVAQIQRGARAKILTRIDGAGAAHGLLTHIAALTTSRRTVRYTVGWTVTDADETAIAALPAGVWSAALRQDGTVQPATGVADLTGLNIRQGWPADQRLIVRRTRPAARHRAKLTVLERSTGWRYTIVATNISRIYGPPGSHHPQWIDVLHRSHATVEDRVRTNRAHPIGQTGQAESPTREHIALTNRDCSPGPPPPTIPAQSPLGPDQHHTTRREQHHAIPTASRDTRRQLRHMRIPLNSGDILEQLRATIRKELFKRRYQLDEISLNQWAGLRSRDFDTAPVQRSKVDSISSLCKPHGRRLS